MTAKDPQTLGALVSHLSCPGPRSCWQECNELAQSPAGTSGAHLSAHEGVQHGGHARCMACCSGEHGHEEAPRLSRAPVPERPHAAPPWAMGRRSHHHPQALQASADAS
ncbi:uncharacterized protein LOC134476525 isoform X1 [Cavia porcellus]|uniref:uncharacterized protein LOC134476525 isoform X1 n=1 Tax=Cavia porcellus TaxID=10141 RepID=UPI002FDF801B